jgi:glycosyltransferase involved in cell wall biosynthesis
MKIEVFAICYNEEIMLPYFLRHYSQFAERIVIYDNYSTDRSEEICRQFPGVEVIKYDSGNQIRDDIYLDIKNNCWKGSTADWVIVCDIDELLYDFGMILADVKSHTIILPEWYEMVSDKLPQGNTQIYYEIGYGVCQGLISKCLIFRPDAIKEINYHPGAHGIEPIGDIRVMETSMIGILHYKYLSADYVIARHAMYQSRLSDINKRMKWGVHYNMIADEIRAQWQSLWDRRQRVI